MNQGIQYNQWPPYVKVATALSSKNFFSSRVYKFPIVLGWILLVAGVAESVYNFAFNKSYSYELLYSLGYLVIGGLSLWTGLASKWIATHSSWEERFENRSSSLNKTIYIVLTILALGLLVGRFFT